MTDNLVELSKLLRKLTYSEMMIFAEDLAGTIDDWTHKQKLRVDANSVAALLSELSAQALREQSQ